MVRQQWPLLGSGHQDPTLSKEGSEGLVGGSFQNAGLSPWPINTASAQHKEQGWSLVIAGFFKCCEDTETRKQALLQR